MDSTYLVILKLYIYIYIYIVLVSIKLICLKFLCTLHSPEHASLSTVWSISLDTCHTVVTHLGLKHQN